MRTKFGLMPYLAFERLLFGEDSVYSYRGYGMPEQAASLTRQDLLDYYRRHCTPGKMFICCCGNVDPDTLTELLNQRIGRWKPEQKGRDGAADCVQTAEHAKPEPRYIPAELAGKSTPTDGRLFVVDCPGAPQSAICAGCLGFSDKEARSLDLQALNALLGNSPCSRLFNNLRERNGYTYHASSGFHSFADCGYFSCTAEVQADKTVAALREMLKEIDFMHQQVSADELRRAVNYLASIFSMRFERQGLLLDSMTEFQVLGYPKDYADTYVSELMKLTPADIKRAADRSLDVDKMLLMIAGDAKVLEPQLREAGWKAQVLTVDEILQPYGKAEQ